MDQEELQFAKIQKAHQELILGMFKKTKKISHKSMAIDNPVSSIGISFQSRIVNHEMILKKKINQVDLFSFYE